MYLCSPPTVSDHQQQQQINEIDGDDDVPEPADDDDVPEPSPKAPMVATPKA
jgi:hypothetical protein